jgi:hypothetical protein
MTLQNRVTPFGEIVAISQRGMFTGNRGILHNPTTKTLGAKRWTSKVWIVCSCDYQDVRRSLMATRSWTELFFFDEAVALSAGHRPCFRCRPCAAKAFSRAWAKAKGEAPNRAPHLDSLLHCERLSGRSKRLHALNEPAALLPDGAMLASNGSAYLIAGGKAFVSGRAGYRPVPTALQFDGLLTPPSTLGALKAGYRPELHPSLSL